MTAPTAPAAPEMKTAPSLTAALLTATAPQRKDLLTHGWTEGAFAGQEGVPGAIRIWAQEDWHFCAHELNALQRLLRYNPPSGLRDLLVGLIADCRREPEMFEEILAELGAQPTTTPSLTCDGYGSWLRCQADDSLLRGLAAIFTAEASYWAMFTTIAASCDDDSPWRPRARNWARPEFGDVVAGLRDGIDALVSPDQVQQACTVLLPVTERGLEWEKRFLDLCWFGQSWPA